MKNKIVLTTLVALLAAASLSACSSNNAGDEKYSFTAALASGKTQIQIGETDKIECTSNGVKPEKEPVYVYSVTDENVATVTDQGVVSGVSLGVVTFTIEDTANNVKAKVSGISVVSTYAAANGGFNYAAAAGKEAIETRTNILGKLEKYAMDSHLTGITLFENGGYAKYREDLLDIPADEYITGYGFGVLAEGNIEGDLTGSDVPTQYKRYYHSAQSSDPLTINALNASGSQVSDLSSYITSSYWGTKMNDDHNGYVWYPCLALDTVNGKAQNRPTPVYDKVNPLGLYNRWRIYVKTGTNGLKYRTLSSARSAFDDRDVALEDYLFIYQALLTGANKMSRGAEMAGDTSYGIKGAQSYYKATENLTDQTLIDNEWNSRIADGRLGLKVDSDSYGSYIEMELVNPIDEFTAMYTLSSSLTSPLPRSFIEAIGEGSIINGMKRYGAFNNGGADAILDYTLCLGPYMLEKWTKKQQIIFKQNNTWVERSTYPNRYKIAGVRIRTIEAATQNEDAIYNEFNAGNLHACGIPTKHLSDEIGQPGVRQTKGDSTFKLNVNSCTQEMWNKLNKEVWKNEEGDTWDVKPWMSNDDFLAGLFYSIDREQFATKRGVQPSINYFSDSYLSDPENGVSYNSTEQHKTAVAGYHSIIDGKDNYGYNPTKAVQKFTAAVNTLAKNGSIAKGTKSAPKVINIHIKWMYESDVTEYGEDIKSYFETCFNNEAVSGGTVKLEVTQDAVTNWEDVYNLWLMKGKFDLGFGAISGNTYNPLNFLEVLKSNNSSGFTLNWGTDTSKLDEKHPLVFDEKEWSFDGLWEVSDHGGVVQNGSIVKSVQHAYMNMPKNLSGVDTNELLNGATIDIPLEFVNVPDVEFDVQNVQLYIVGYGNENLTYSYDSTNKVIHVTISAADGQKWNTQMRETNKLRDEDPNPDAKPFILGKYGVYWTIEVYYTISIKKGTPSQSYVTVAKNKDAEEQ